MKFEARSLHPTTKSTEPVEYVITGAAAGKRLRQRRHRRIVAAVATVAVAAGFSVARFAESLDPDNCHKVGTEPVAAGRGIEDAVLRTERGLRSFEVARSVDESIKVNPRGVIPLGSQVQIVHCFRGGLRPDTFVGRNPVR